MHGPNFYAWVINNARIVTFLVSNIARSTSFAIYKSTAAKICIELIGSNCQQDISSCLDALRIVRIVFLPTALKVRKGLGLVNIYSGGGGIDQRQSKHHCLSSCGGCNTYHQVLMAIYHFYLFCELSMIHIDIYSEEPLTRVRASIIASQAAVAVAHILMNIYCIYIFREIFIIHKDIYSEGGIDQRAPC